MKSRYLGLFCLFLLNSNVIIASDDVEEIFQLPAPDSHSGQSGETRTLNFGEKISMDELGPIIVNPDGTMRRIANWNELTKAEQESTFRQISARNKRRIEALRESTTVNQESEVE